MARISRSTSLPAEGEYLRPVEDFFARLELDFFEAEPRVLFFALPREERLELPLRDLLPLDDRDRDDLLRELLLDFFFAAFFVVAITILLGGQMAGRLERVACGGGRKVASRSHGCICCQTTRRIPGMRTGGSAISHVAMQLRVPVMMNLGIAGATSG